MKYFFLVATFAEVAPFPSCIATIVKKKLSRHNNLKPTNTTLSQQETKKIENSQFIEKKKKKNVLVLVFTATFASFTFVKGKVFSSWAQCS